MGVTRRFTSPKKKSTGISRLPQKPNSLSNALGIIIGYKNRINKQKIFKEKKNKKKEIGIS